MSRVFFILFPSLGYLVLVGVFSFTMTMFQLMPTCYACNCHLRLGPHSAPHDLQPVDSDSRLRPEWTQQILFFKFWGVSESAVWAVDVSFFWGVEGIQAKDLQFAPECWLDLTKGLWSKPHHGSWSYHRVTFRMRPSSLFSEMDSLSGDRKQTAGGSTSPQVVLISLSDFNIKTKAYK